MIAAHLFLVTEGGSILLLKNYGGCIDSLLLSHFWIFLMLWEGFNLRTCWSVVKGHNNTESSEVNAMLGRLRPNHVLIVSDDCPKSRSDRINHLLVQGPKRIPFKGENGLRGTL